MMHSVIYAPEAEAQLVALFLHIAAAASPEIAARYTDAIVKHAKA
jgi:plasmid stabilization system protein ParE